MHLIILLLPSLSDQDAHYYALARVETDNFIQDYSWMEQLLR